MFIINPKNQRVLTLKPDMKMQEKGKQTIISWERPTFIHDKVDTINFIVDKNYDQLSKDFESYKQFIMAQWAELIK